MNTASLFITLASGIIGIAVVLGALVAFKRSFKSEILEEQEHLLETRQQTIADLRADISDLKHQNEEQAIQIKDLQTAIRVVKDTAKDTFTDGMIIKISTEVIDLVRHELQGGNYAR